MVDIKWLHGAALAIEETLNDDGDASKALRDLFDLFRTTELSFADTRQARLRDEARYDALTDVQTIIMNIASSVPARTMQDVAYKLALWRWDAAELGCGCRQRSDHVMCSLFDDVADAAGVPGVEPPPALCAA